MTRRPSFPTIKLWLNPVPVRTQVRGKWIAHQSNSGQWGVSHLIDHDWTVGGVVTLGDESVLITGVKPACSPYTFYSHDIFGSWYQEAVQWPLQSLTRRYLIGEKIGDVPTRTCKRCARILDGGHS